MADDIDRATELQELMNRAAQQQRRASGPLATGFCLSCGEALKNGRRWCDAECRDDFERSLDR